MKKQIPWFIFLLALGLGSFAGVSWVLENMEWAPGGEAAAIGLLIFGCLGGLALLLYFLPTVIAASGHSRNTQAIFLLNLFLGWTLLGWVGALVWAVYR